MSFLFDFCKSLEKLHMINFDTSSATIMNRIFDGCKLLTDIDLSKFIVNEKISIHASFWDCHPKLVEKVKREVLNINIEGRKAFK